MEELKQVKFKFSKGYYLGRQIKDKYAYDHINMLRTRGVPSDVSVVKLDIDNKPIPITDYKEHKLDFNKVIVANQDSFEHLITNYKKTDKILVMVFASGTNRCGGMVNGKIAQEEQICKLTDAPHILETYGITHKMYYDKDRCMILIKNASLLLDINYKPLDYPIKIDMLFAAAPHLQENTLPSLEQDHFMDKMIEGTFKIIAENGFTNQSYTKAYLGAFGCGCFNWDANIVSKKFIKFHKLYANKICDVFYIIKDIKGYNYKAFDKTFTKN